jgi:hypothetical protein
MSAMRLAAWTAAWTGAWLVLPLDARADTSDEVIDEVIDDAPAAVSPAARAAPAPWTWRARAGQDPSTLRLAATHRSTVFVGEAPPGLAHTRFEHRTFAVVGARSPAGERDPWRLEVRADLVQRAGEGFGEAVSTDFEARPWELWWRTKTSETTTLTLGYQTLAWGTLDAGAAADVFASYDLRLGPALAPAEIRMPLPAARLVWSPGARVDVELVALPFFTPHRFDVAGTRYAALGGASLGPLARAFDAGTLSRITEPLARANGVDANPLDGELGARTTLHTAAADLSFTAALARSRLPTFRASEALVSALTTGSAAAALRLEQDLASGQLPLRAVHDRYVQIALDAQGSVGRFPWGLELGLSSKRDLLPAGGLTSSAAPRAHVAQGGLRVSTNEGGLTVSAQATLYALLDPSSPEATVSVSPVVFGASRTLGLALVGARYELERFTFEASALGLCAAPLGGSGACASESLLASGRVGYGDDAITVSLFGTALVKSANAALPLGSAIDQVGVRIDWVPAQR